MKRWLWILIPGIVMACAVSAQPIQIKPGLTTRISAFTDRMGCCLRVQNTTGRLARWFRWLDRKIIPRHH